MNWAELPPDQLSTACATGAAAAWEEFMRRYHHLILAAASRVSRRWGQNSAEQIDDIVQEIYLRLCSNRAHVLTEFDSSVPEAMFGYLKTVATNVAHDYFRRQQARKRGPAQPVELEKVMAVTGKDDKLERQVALSEVERLLVASTQGETGVRDRAIFKLYYRQGLTAKAIAALPGIPLSAKGVEGVLHRLTRTIRNAINQPQGIDVDPRTRKQEGIGT